jgi:hypothetical protein
MEILRSSIEHQLRQTFIFVFSVWLSAREGNGPYQSIQMLVLAFLPQVLPLSKVQSKLSGIRAFDGSHFSLLFDK